MTFKIKISFFKEKNSTAMIFTKNQNIKNLFYV